MDARGVSPEQRAKLYRLLLKLEAEDLAVRLGRVADVRDLPVNVRGEMADVLGNEAALHGCDRSGRRNSYGAELDELVDALEPRRAIDPSAHPPA